MSGSTAAQWAKRVERWRDSGLTTKQYAAETGINPSTLAYWRWKLGSSERAEAGRSKQAPASSGKPRARKPASSSRAQPISSAPWVELPLASLAGSSAMLELVVRDEVRLRIPAGVDETTLARVVRVLGVVP